MSIDLRSIRLDHEQLAHVRDTLRDRIREGLARDGCEIRALSAHLPPPTADLQGLAVAIDAGGTHVRATLVELASERTPRIVRGPLHARLLLDRADGSDSADAFFDRQAALAAELEPPEDVPVGYCFSYPTTIHADLDATLIRWTKGVAIPEVEGKRVGSLLAAALERRNVRARHVRVVNDTVASLLAGTLVDRGLDPSNGIGLIVGTGTNMAGFFSTALAPKLSGIRQAEKIAVNLESGNFSPPFLSRHDDAVDAASDNRGAQRFEKAVSGRYLPLLFATILPKCAHLVAGRGSEALVELRGSSDNDDVRRVADALLARSADLTASALAAMLGYYESPRVVRIVAEGSLFFGDPFYQGRVAATLGALVRPERSFEILRVAESNAIGCAIAALTRL